MTWSLKAAPKIAYLEVMPHDLQVGLAAVTSKPEPSVELLR